MTDPRPKYLRVLPSGSVSRKIDEGLKLLSDSFDYSVGASASIGVGAKANRSERVNNEINHLITVFNPSLSNCFRLKF